MCIPAIGRKPAILLGIGAAAVAAQAWLLADLAGQSRAHDPLYPRIPRGGRTAAEDRRDERLPMGVRLYRADLTWIMIRIGEIADHEKKYMIGVIALKPTDRW